MWSVHGNEWSHQFDDDLYIKSSKRSKTCVQFLFGLINYPTSLIRFWNVLSLSPSWLVSQLEKSQCTSWIRKQRLYERCTNTHTIIDEKGKKMDNVHNYLRALVMGTHFSGEEPAFLYFFFRFIFCFLFIIFLINYHSLSVTLRIWHHLFFPKQFLGAF